MRLRRRSVDIVVQDEDHTDAPALDAPHAEAPNAPGDATRDDRTDTLALADRLSPIYWFAPGVVPPTRRNGHPSPEAALAPTAATPVSLVPPERGTTPPEPGRDVAPVEPAVVTTVRSSRTDVAKTTSATRPSASAGCTAR